MLVFDASESLNLIPWDSAKKGTPGSIAHTQFRHASCPGGEIWEENPQSTGRKFKLRTHRVQAEIKLPTTEV